MTSGPERLDRWVLVAHAEVRPAAVCPDDPALPRLDRVLLYHARRSRTVRRIAELAEVPAELAAARLEALETAGRCRLSEIPPDPLVRPEGSCSVRDLWVGAVARYGPRPYLRWSEEGAVFTYADADVIVRRYVTLLRARGLRPGDCVVMEPAGRPESVFVLVAAWLSGITTGLVHLDSTAAYIQGLARRVGARDTWLGAPRPELPEAWLYTTEDDALGDTLLDAAPAQDLPALPEDHPAMVVFTSGSSGPSKGVVVGHGALWRTSAITAMAHGWTPEDCYVMAASLANITGARVATLMPLHVGASVLLAPRHAGPLGLLRAAADHGATLLGSSVMFATWCLQNVERAAPLLQAGRLRLAFTTGSPLPRDVRERFWRSFGVPLADAYGLTETSGPCLITHRGLARGEDPGVGKPWEALAEMRDEAGNVVPDGTPGTLWIYTENRMLRYLDDAGGGRTVAGWLDTGDLGWRDTTGAYHLTGRASRVFLAASGEKLHPEPMEHFACAEVGATACAVLPVGKPYPRLHLVLEHEAPPPDWVPRLTEAIRARWVPGHLPVGFHAWPALPRTPSGKVDLQAIEARLA